MPDWATPYRARVESHLQSILAFADQQVPETLQRVMQYGVLGGGKRLRPILTYLATEALGGSLAAADRSASAIELIHCYSLIHDDLPAMDDDDLRRGRPTVHIQFGEASAILAGDALQALAFDLVAGDDRLTPECRIGVISTLSSAAGASGMVAGQVLDLAAETEAVDAGELINIHHRKTGDLIASSVICGGLIAGADTETSGLLERYGRSLGLAFQVQDDILDAVGDAQTMGKQRGSDEARNKSTFITLHGLEAARTILAGLTVEAKQAIDFLGDRGEPLREIAEFVASRDH